MRNLLWVFRPVLVALISAGVAALVILSGYFFRWKPVTVIYNGDKAQQPALRMQIYPARAEDGNHPAVLFFHGGGWITGSPDQFKWFAESFAACGIVSALVEYRVHSRHGTLPDRAVDDASTAYRWMQRNHARFGVNPTHIAVVGGSAGAHIAAASAFQCGTPGGCNKMEGTQPVALGLLNPVLDLTLADEAQGYTKEELQLIQALGEKSAEALSLGDKLATSTIPTHIVYGELDPLLPVANRLFSSHTTGLPANPEILVAAGEGHGFFNYEPWRSAVADSLLEFLKANGLDVDCESKHRSQVMLQKMVYPSPSSDSPARDRPPE